MPEIDDPVNKNWPMTDPHDLPLVMHPFANELQIQMAVFIPGRGWLHTRRGIVTHGIIPPWDNEEAALLEVKNALKAMRHRLEMPDALE